MRHTNLGRAPLPETVVDEFRRSATQYSNLEYDLEAGTRGKRDVHTSESLTRLTGAEAAIVVNNCAAAVLVTLAALARGGGAGVAPREPLGNRLCRRTTAKLGPRRPMPRAIRT